MSGNAIKLPTAARSYITVRKNRDFWDVFLATPMPGQTLKTRLYSSSDKAQSFDLGRRTAAQMQRPFKARGGAK